MWILILTTHYNKICTKFKKDENIQNYQMNVVQDKNDKLIYTYKLRKGISRIQGAIKILEQMEYSKRNYPRCQTFITLKEQKNVENSKKLTVSEAVA